MRWHHAPSSQHFACAFPHFEAASPFECCRFDCVVHGSTQASLVWKLSCRDPDHQQEFHPVALTDVARRHHQQHQLRFSATRCPEQSRASASKQAQCAGAAEWEWSCDPQEATPPLVRRRRRQCHHSQAPRHRDCQIPDSAKPRLHPPVMHCVHLLLRRHLPPSLHCLEVVWLLAAWTSSHPWQGRHPRPPARVVRRVRSPSNFLLETTARDTH